MKFRKRKPIKLSLDNPVTMLMMLYSSLVIPFHSCVMKHEREVNDFIQELAETIKKEDNTKVSFVWILKEALNNPETQVSFYEYKKKNYATFLANDVRITFSRENMELFITKLNDLLLKKNK